MWEQFGLRPIDGVNILILLALVWILIRLVNDPNNSIIMADYIASRGVDGKQHGDLDKVGQIVGIVVSAMTVLMYADNKTVEPTGLSILLGVSLLYLGGVSMYAKYIRSKRDPQPLGAITDSKTEIHTQELK